MTTTHVGSRPARGRAAPSRLPPAASCFPLRIVGFQREFQKSPHAAASGDGCPKLGRCVCVCVCVCRVRLCACQETLPPPPPAGPCLQPPSPFDPQPRPQWHRPPRPPTTESHFFVHRVAVFSAARSRFGAPAGVPVPPPHNECAADGPSAHRSVAGSPRPRGGGVSPIHSLGWRSRGAAIQKAAAQGAGGRSELGGCEFDRSARRRWHRPLPRQGAPTRCDAVLRRRVRPVPVAASGRAVWGRATCPHSVVPASVLSAWHTTAPCVARRTRQRGGGFALSLSPLLLLGTDRWRYGVVLTCGTAQRRWGSTSGWGGFPRSRSVTAPHGALLDRPDHLCRGLLRSEVIKAPSNPRGEAEQGAAG